MKINILRLLDKYDETIFNFQKGGLVVKAARRQGWNYKKTLRQTQGYIHSCKTINSFQTLNFFNTFLIDGQGPTIYERAYNIRMKMEKNSGMNE